MHLFHVVSIIALGAVSTGTMQRLEETMATCEGWQGIVRIE